MVKPFAYDEENDILAVHKPFSNDEKFKGNVDLGDIILDISTRGRIKGLEILNFSQFLKTLGIDERVIENLTDVSFETVIKSNVIYVIVLLKDDDRETPARIAVPIPNSAASSAC